MKKQVFFVVGVVTSCCLVVTMMLPGNQERPQGVTAPAQALRCVHAESVSVSCIIHCIYHPQVADIPITC